MLKKPLTLFAALCATLGAGAIGSSVYASSNSCNCDIVDANIFVNLSKKIVPSVVNISTTMTVKQQGGGLNPGSPDDLFRKFFEDYFHNHGGQMGPRGGGGGDDEDDGDDQGAPPPPQKNGKKVPNAMSLGTGFIIDASGLILTNNHVVADADEIKITFTEDPDEKPTDGQVVGRDLELDLALIKVKTKRELTPVVLGNSDSLEVGEYVIAVGNPFGQGHSVTHGIISAKGRLSPDFPLTSYLQTDAPINPGNSGGPLVNLKGEVIGINNAIDQRAQGIGFAIPISVVKKVLPQLKTKGMVSRGYIGVLINELTPEVAQQMGVPKDMKAPFVTEAIPGDPADKAGLKPYDIILEFNGKDVHSGGELVAAVTSVNVGDTVPIKVLRNGKDVSLKIKVTQRPGMQAISEKEKTEPKKKGAAHLDTGMTLDDITPDIARELGMPEKSHGIVVSQVGYGSAADRAGITRGDVILEVNRKPIKDTDAFYAIVKEKKSYLLRVRRMDPSGREAFAVIVLDLKE
jgi:serine protease Do